MIKKETPIRQNENFLIIILSSIIILGLLCFYFNQDDKDRVKTNNKPGIEGQFCGGIAANLPENQCPDGFYCKLDNNYPDASGICLKEAGQNSIISDSELLLGWYWGMEDQKKLNTPTNWIYTKAGRNSCWHEVNTQCIFLPD